MVLHYSEIHVAEKAMARLRKLDLVTLPQDEFKLLLIHGSRSEQSSIHPVKNPLRGILCLHHFCKSFNLVADASASAMAEADHPDIFLAFPDFDPIRLLRERKADPAELNILLS